jgi:EAL and modified HD-GYP domain-containing signal transduction protein
MKVFVARQPIFDLRQRVRGYELLFREGQQNAFGHADGDLATQSVISYIVHAFGERDLTGGRRAFINFTRPLLVARAALVLPPDRVAIEILETVEPDDEVIRACRGLKSSGYFLALDDYWPRTDYDALVALADCIKVDFRRCSSAERRQIAEQFLPRSIRLIAEKVETPEDHAEAVALGYHLFQGYYFSRPQVITRQDLQSSKLVCLRFLREVNQPELDYGRLEQLVKEDVSMSVKLLRYINSAWFGLSRRVRSLRHALILLGAEGLQRWGSLIVATSIARDKPSELVIVCLLRAAFCERLAPLAGLASTASEAFLVGLFSALDALVDRPLAEVIDEVALPPAVRETLLGTPTPLQPLYQLTLAYERGDWTTVETLMAALHLEEAALPEVYTESLRWVNRILAT